VADEPFHFNHTRRHSNSGTTEHLKTKFEFNEPEPVFEESVHGPEEHEELTKTNTSSSDGSVEEERNIVKD